MEILDGRKARDSEREALKARVTALGRAPVLAIIQVGDIKESSIYISQKVTFAKTVGADARHVRLAADISFDNLKAEINKHNVDATVDGIIVQLPLPAHLDKDAVINLIDPSKDVDGLTDENQRLLAEGKPRFVPATAKGIMTLLHFYNIDPKGKKVCVLGRSRLVGSPTAKMLEMAGADVSVCHSKTTDAPAVACQAEILVSAIGKPGLVDASYLKEGVVVVDVGLTVVPDKGLVGDVDRTAIDRLASAATPVPGGVGPMTVLSLFANLVSSAETRGR
ncbi:MAG: bifunctional 5,10-methylenetetrahydrofolate dehydrogenase/5,10-methenyltetrahydrofolate cyclohydrolase [bacterium]|nr:bifunctional 5,10-methylenetetrahydrofolate dehydrogenase/5,10-methenyltetrahydrofolate cyclohydrolase [bacterium]